jgi:uncharacterized protein YciI
VDAHVPQRAKGPRLIRFLLVAALAFGAVGAGAQASAPASAGAPVAGRLLFAVEIRSGANWNAALPPNQQAFMREHSAHLRKLRDEGRIRIGARYGDVGLIVLEAATIDEARAWMQADPSMQAGTFRFEIHPFGVFYGGSVGR